ncbi:hypothetical protein Ancab_023307 [Ancistrocladus abbreviatus]
MEPPKEYKQLYQNYLVQGNEELHPVSERFMHDATNCINMDTAPQAFSIPEFKPVLNFSIQTGEEFVLEFMRDRVLPCKPAVQKPVGDLNYASGYMDLKGILGISHTESESGSDVSLLTMVEKGPKDFERKNSSFYEEKTHYGSTHSIQQDMSGYDSSRGIFHGYASSRTSESSSTKIKILCSFGGKILPRPSDQKLRYVGGETRIMRISRDISWQELQQRTMAILNQAHTIKYQLPGEDLDALVSVSSSDDLQNMMEECNVLGDGEASKKHRIFLFTLSDVDDADYSLSSADVDSEIQYVVAVNGMEMGSRKNSGLLASSSANNLGELASLNAEWVMKGGATESVGIRSVTLTRISSASSAVQHSQRIMYGSSNPGQSHPQFQGQMMPPEEAGGYVLHQGKDSYLSGYPPSGESSLFGFMTNQRTLTEEQLYGDSKLNDSDNLVREAKVSESTSVQQENKAEKVQPMKHNYQVPVKPYDGNMIDNFLAEDAPRSYVTALTVKETPGLPPKSERKHRGSVQGPSASDSAIMAQLPKSVSEGNSHTCDSALSTDFAACESDGFDMSHLELPMPTQRVYYSERIPREQAELLNRLSKSDDSLNSQFLMSHSHSGDGQQDLVVDVSEKLQNETVGPQSGHSVSAGNAPQMDSQLIEGGAVGQGLPKLSGEMSESKSNQAVHNPVDQKGSLVEKEFVEYNSQTMCAKDNHKQHLVDELGGSKLSTMCRATHGERQDPSSTDLGISWPGPAGLNSTGNITCVSGHEQGDILIDINDRFPRDFLLDIFSKALNSEEFSGISQLQQDGAGLSMNVENHDPKHWSFFQKLAKDDFSRKDVSLIDQDHPVYSSSLAKVEEEAPGSYQFTQLETDKLLSSHVDSHIDYHEYSQKELTGTVGTDQVLLHADYNPSQVKVSEGIQFDGMTDIAYSKYEDGNHDIKNFGLPPLDPSLIDFDISTLQLIKNDDLEELRELGSGTFGTVYHGKWRGSDVAIKRIKKSCFTGRTSEQERLAIEFWREAVILSKLHHPNVVAFYGVVQDGPGETLATVTEYMVDGSLRHVLLRKDRHLDRRKRLIIAMDAAFGMEYLHSKNIVHFDLKCDNLLVNLKDPSRPICKVGDFGLSKIKRNTLVSGGVRGTLPWMAPELLNGSSNKVSEKVDVFSFGIVLWEILTGEEPYANMHYGAIIGGIVNKTLRPPIPNYCDQEWRKLMEQCWAPNPVARPSFTDIASQLRSMAAACQSQPRGQVQRPAQAIAKE